mgnify:CR=1 FL=1
MLLKSSGYCKDRLFLFLLLLSGALRGESTSLSSGIYSEPQAERGADLYVVHCAHCHLPGFYTNVDVAWNGMSVLDFYYKVSGSMPADNPRNLSQSEYLNIVAWVLAVNGYPSGNSPMLLSNKLGLVKFKSNK